MANLTDLDLRILEFAEKREQGSAAHVIAVFGWTPTAYTQRLLALVNRDDVEADPRWTMLVHRIRKVAAQRTADRAGRRFSRAG